MSRVLITGAAGFIGSRLAETVALEGAEVVSVDLERHFEERAEHHGFVFGEIVDRDRLFDWLDASAPALDRIFHIGACSSTMETDENYLRRVNVEYSQKLWEYATRKRIPFYYASSAATYGDGSQGFDDSEELLPRLRPLNAYGRSKHLFDLWALEQERKGSHPPAWAGFKFFNVYGFGERHKSNQASVVLHAYDQIRATGKLRLFKSHHPDYRDGEQKRDFIAVEDVVSVLLFAAEKPVRRGIFNLGTGQARTFLDLARATFDALETPESIEFIPTPESIRDKYQYFTEARMEKLRALGYPEPFLSLEEGISEYVRRLALRSALSSGS
jgi:ADP-L-glycero-D-manno-heptose 6-epimerase